MVRRAAQPKPEPASLPEVLIPPSEAAANERSAYWLELIDNPTEFKKAIATEDFFPLLRKFPDALWTDNRLSLYLYRRPDEQGRILKNAEGAKKYKKVFHEPVDEENISQTWGGGKYTLYLKLDNDITLRECTFMIDGPPKMQDGEVIATNGAPVSTAPAAVPEERTDIAKVIDASAKANESAMGILAHASKTAIDMVKEQTPKDGTPQKDPVDTLKTMLEIVRMQQPPAGNAMKDALEIVDRLDAMAARRNPPPAKDDDEPTTPLKESMDLIERFTGKTVPELMEPAAARAAENATPPWVPVVLSAAQSLIEKIPLMMHERNEGLRLEIQLRSMATGQPVPQGLLKPAPPPNTQTRGAQPPPGNPPNVIAANAPLEPEQVVTGIVTMICQKFDRNPRQGYETAAAIAYSFDDAIESLGLDKTLGHPDKAQEFVAGVPELQRRSLDARWPMFFQDFMSYASDHWGDDEQETIDEPETKVARPRPKKSPQPAA